MFEEIFDGYASEHSKVHEELNIAQQSTETDLATLADRIEQLERRVQYLDANRLALTATIALLIQVLSGTYPRFLNTLREIKIVHRGKPADEATRIKTKIAGIIEDRLERKAK